MFSAIDPHNYVDRTSAVIYDSTNGLPTNGVNDIAQTKEGFLWIGSYCGLIRYDGNYFELLDASSGLSSIESLFVDSQDRLWIGTNDSGLALMDRGELRFWDEDHGFPSAKVGDVQESEDGTIYVATTEGLVMITPDLVAHTADDPRLADAYVEQLSYGSGDLLYGITNEDDYFALRSGKLETYIDHTQTRIQGITSILADPNNPGEIYIGTDSGKLYHGDPDGEISAMECTDTAPLTNIYDIQSFGDQIWICASNGIGVVHGDGFHYLDELPMHNAVSGVIADYEGNLWFTSSRQGLMKVVPNRFVNIFPHYDLPECVVNSTYEDEDDGRLYIATDTGLLVVTEDEVKDLIEQGTEDGTFEQTEQDLVDRVFHMSDQTAYSLMTPRTQMMWLDINDSLDHNLDLIKNASEYIIPVGRDSLDELLSTVHRHLPELPY